jgi:hypothetical protein
VTDHTLSVSLLYSAADVIARSAWVHNLIVRQVSGHGEQNSGSACAATLSMIGSGTDCDSRPAF